MSALHILQVLDFQMAAEDAEWLEFKAEMLRVESAALCPHDGDYWPATSRWPAQCAQCGAQLELVYGRYQTRAPDAGLRWRICSGE